MKIQSISALEVLDSRGNPTVRAYVQLENGSIGVAMVPSGASTGTHEMLELRDRDKKRYLGQGVLKAVKNINEIIIQELKGESIENLKKIDQRMIDLDGTENKSRLGANAILAVSLACIRALSVAKKQPLWQTLSEYYFQETKPDLPRLFVNVINGGRHANWNFDIQEFIISPQNKKTPEAVRISSEIFHVLGSQLKKLGFQTLVGDEGGYSPSLKSNDEVFKYVSNAISEAGYEGQVDLAIDAAASEFYKDGQYVLKKQNKTLSADELTDYYLSLQKEYGIFSFEDPFFEDDWEAFVTLTQRLGPKAYTVGDDLYATNPERIKQGIAQKATSAVLIKANQIGTLSETAEAINLCKQNGFAVIISHRSGETEDSFIADLSVSCAADFIKTGSMSRSDRLAKYNRLLEIEKNEM